MWVIKEKERNWGKKDKYALAPTSKQQSSYISKHYLTSQTKSIVWIKHPSTLTKKHQNIIGQSNTYGAVLKKSNCCEQSIRKECWSWISKSIKD